VTAADRVRKISYQHLEILVERFMSKEFGIAELQSRLNTALMPDKPIPDYSSGLQELNNDLELILYTKLETEHFLLAKKALDDFLGFLKKNY
jgi:hypothetical protein